MLKTSLSIFFCDSDTAFGIINDVIFVALPMFLFSLQYSWYKANIFTNQLH